MKNNSYRKQYPVDKFGWKFYTKRSARNLKRTDKRFSRKRVRLNGKRQIRSEMRDIDLENKD